jgi:long-chain acyl-CoA synthetase
MNIATLLQRTAAAFADRPALASGRRVVADYGEFHQRVARLAYALREHHGVRPGDRVGLFCANHAGFFEACYAVWTAGAAVVPVNAKLHAREAAYILEHSAVRACWVDASHRTMLDGVCQAAPLLDIESVSELLGAQALPIEPRSADDLAWLFYTSGTTGHPKGAMLSHGNLLQATLAYLAGVQPVQPGDVLLHAAPQSHGSGLYNFAYVASAGLNVVPDSRGFDETEVLELAQHYPGVSLFAAPTMVRRLVDAAGRNPQAVQHLGTIIYGGGPMYVSDIEDGLRVMGNRFAQIYGQGEAPMTITVLPRHVIGDAAHPRHPHRLASVGFAHMSVEVAVRDPQGRPLPAGEIGEICVKGPVVMQGYWNNPQATRETLRDGWLHTGDLGAFDEDGFLTLKDRSKDVIISGGSNIYPREVEEVLLTHPRVREVSVVGQPDAEWGENVVAFVVADGMLDTSELDALCLRNIARFKRPKEYRFIGELPKNNYGKVLKTALRERLAQAQT